MDSRKLFYAALAGVAVSAVAVSDVSAYQFEEHAEFVNPVYHNVATPLNHPVVAYHTTTLQASSLAQLKSVIENELDKRSTHISVYYTGDMSNIMNEMEHILNTYIYENDYFRGIMSRAAYGYEGSMLEIELDYLTTPAQEAFIQSEVERIVSEITTPSMSDVEKVKAIHDYVVLNTTYSYNSSTTPHAAYALFNEGKGVCQAYALATYRLLEEAGMEVRYVTGYAGEPHAWNLVKVDGEWYHLDTTWDDPTFNEDVGDMSDYIQYGYFLISDKEITKDHQIDTESDYPKATSERFVQVRGVREPARVGTVLYYWNRNDDFKLYNINLLDVVPQPKKVSNTRVQHLFYANDWLYFSNYSDGAYLYKIRLDGSKETLLVRSKVTDIKQVGNELVAYSNNSVIYREEIEVKVPSSVVRITELVREVEYLHPSFKRKAEEIIGLVDSLTAKEKALLSQETLMQIAEINEKYEKLTTLSFQNSGQWEAAWNITNPMKPWTITVSEEVLNTKENVKQIELVDMFGEKVAADVTIAGTKVTVTPKTAYIQNIPYTLIIKSGLQSKNGNTLKKGVHLSFMFKSK